MEKEIVKMSDIENVAERFNNIKFENKLDYFYRKLYKKYKIFKEDFPKLLHKIEIISSALEKDYKNKWDIYLDCFYNEDKEHYEPRVFFLIYYPRTYIKDFTETKHLIKDLFLKISLCNNGRINSLKVLRTSYNESERLYGYIHSHAASLISLTKSNLIEGVQLCFGTDTDVSNSYKNFIESPNENTFLYFLFCFKCFLKWEASDGVPYKSISDIYINKSFQNVYFLDDGFSNKVIKNIVRRQHEKFDFYIEEGRYKIRINSELEQAIINELVEEELLVNLVYKNSDGTYTQGLDMKGKTFVSVSEIKSTKRIDVTQVHYKDKNLPYLNFRGNRLYLKIWREKTDYFIKESLQLNPRSLNKLIKNLENELYEKQIRNSIIKRYNRRNITYTHSK